MALDIAGGQFLNATSGGVMLGLDPTTGVPNVNGRQVAFVVRHSSGTINPGSNIVFNVYSLGSPTQIYSTTTGKVTIPITGTYQLMWQQLLANTGAIGTYTFSFEINGSITNNPSCIYYRQSTNSWQTVRLNSQFNFVAGDTIAIRYVTGSGAMYVDQSYNMFAGYLVR